MDESLFITSSLLPVPHAFSTRRGGVSSPPWSSLNLGHGLGDTPERVEENLRRLSSALELPLSSLHTVRQVHGDRVLQADVRSGSAERGAEADALWTEAVGEAVGVRTADCVPLLLVDPRNQRVAAIHAGWRGTALEIGARAVEAWSLLGSRPERLLAALGPHIRRCCYAVSSDLAAQFSAQFGSEVIDLRRGPDGFNDTYHLDLALAVRRTLERVGLKPGQIDATGPCTACDGGRFFSHRRDEGKTGRQLSVAICRF